MAGDGCFERGLEAREVVGEGDRTQLRGVEGAAGGARGDVGEGAFGGLGGG